MTAVDAPAPPAPAGPSVPAVSPAPPAPAGRCVGDPDAYWRLLARGAALLAVTLGIYRFWFATDVRRFLWSNTEVAGETLEYSGTAVELLIGFLIAMAVLVPLNVAIFVVALNLGGFSELAGVLTFPLLAFLGQFAIYRARRYRLTRTIYRGVRCHQTGSAWHYAVCALFWWVLIILTLGLAYPFAQSRLERFKLRNTHYGNLRGSFEGSGIRLFLRGFVMWLLVVGPLIGTIVYAVTNVDWERVAEAAAISGPSEFFSQMENVPGFYTSIIAGIVAVGASVALAALLFPVFQAMMLRWWLSGIRFGGLTIRSHLRTGHIYGAYLLFLLYSVVFSLLAAVVLGSIVAAFNKGLAPLGPPDLMEIVGTLGAVGIYVVMMLGYSTIYQGTVKLALWQRAVESVELEGLAVLGQVKAEGAASSAVGEGLADALNVGGI
jgi:uncharacterized membrane protein YjgN (DUF898 family)